MRTTEFDQTFEDMSAPEYPATCDECGVEGTNASMEEHECNSTSRLTGDHSQLPWIAHDDDGTGTLPCVLADQVNGYGNFYVAQCNQFADAQFIAKTANNHAQLVAALKQFISIYPPNARRHPDVAIAIQTAEDVLSRVRE